MTALLLIVFAYLIGSVPSGYIIIRLRTGQDLTRVGSGRTGGANAMRAGGLAAGFITGALDILKGAAAVWLARGLITGDGAGFASPHWVEAAVAVAVVIGHNWSLFLGFRGGAGTGPNVGAAMALWPFCGLVLPPLVPLVLFTTGFASVASLTTAWLVPLLFLLAARFAGLPGEYVVYGLATCIVVTWSLRPNIVRLLNGTERRVTFPKRKQAQPLAR